MRTLWIGIGLLALAGAMPAQRTEELNFVLGLSQYRDFRNTLPHWLQRRALDLLEQRKRAVSSAADRKALVRKRMNAVLGGFPERTPLNPRVVGTLERDGYRIEKIIFESQPELYVTANLYLPTRGTPPYPAILYPLGHEPGGKSYPVWQQMLGSLARKGYIALTWDPLGQGERAQFWDRDNEDTKLRSSTTEHTMLTAQCLLVGDHLARYTVWDGIRALDYLLSRKEADARHVGCTGNSGGGTHTSYISALEDRIHAAAPSCYITSWERLLDALGPQDGEQNFPFWLSDGLDFPDFLYAFAPRPFLMLSAIRDFFPIDGARATYAEARKLYDNLSMFEADDGHGYTAPRRAAAYRFFGRWLKGAEDNEPETDVPPATAEELYCTKTGQVTTSLGGEDVFSLNGKRAQEFQARRPAFSLDAVRELIRFERPQGAVPVKPYGTIAHSGYRIEKLMYESEPGILVPALLFAPDAGPAKKPALLIADGKGKTGSLADAERFVRDGFVVLSIDARDLGETNADPNANRRDSPGVFGDYRNSMTALLVGKTMVGMRVTDIVRGLDLLAARSDVDAGRLTAIGKGTAAVATLYATALDPRIRKVTLEEMLVSYHSIVEHRMHQQIWEHVVPGALRRFDLPDLAKSIAPREVEIVRPINSLGHAAALESVQREYSGARVR
jgi:cephalosporin-C deacetylase-like acetyl esterase